MLMRSSDFYEALPPRCCDTCGEKMEEMADCYASTCTRCQGVTFYPLSPAVSFKPGLPRTTGTVLLPSAANPDQDD